MDYLHQRRNYLPASSATRYGFILPVTFEGLIELMKGLGHYGFDIVDLPSQKELRK